MEEKDKANSVCINCSDDEGAMVLTLVNMGGQIRVNICLYPIGESLEYHYTSIQYWESIGKPLLMWNGSCSVSTQTFLFSNAPGELLNSHYPFLLSPKYCFFPVIIYIMHQTVIISIMIMRVAPKSI